MATKQNLQSVDQAATPGDQPASVISYNDYNTMTMRWQYNNNAMTVQWQYNDNTMTMRWQYDDNAMTMRWQYNDHATRVVSCMKMTITDVSNCDQAVSVISYEMIIAMFLRRTKTKCTTDLTVHDKACGDWVYCVLWWPGCHQRAIWNPPSLPVPRVKTSLWGLLIIFYLSSVIRWQIHFDFF